MTVKCLNEHAKNSIAQAYLADKTQDELAIIWNVSRRTIQRVLMEEGIIPPTGTRMVVTDDERKILHTLKQNKINHEQLVKHLKTPPLSAKNIVSTLGRIENPQFEHIMAMVAGARQSTPEGAYAAH